MNGWYVIGGIIAAAVLLPSAVMAYLWKLAPATSMQTEAGRAELAKYGFEFKQELPCEPEWSVIDE